MDDFRVSSVPPSEAYGERHTYDSAARKRQRHHHGEEGHEEEEPSDVFEANSGEDDAPATVEGGVEDYYVPSDRAPEDE